MTRSKTPRQNTETVYAKYIKRILDMLTALVVLLVFSPVFLVLAIAVRLTSYGPILFGQKRTGLDGKTFTMYKFRSMVADNDVHDANSEDKHTRIGRFMRYTSLDELPQIINILRGDMSFIGPRPWITEYHRYFTKKQKLRNSVRPGITGRAQAFGRNALSIKDKIAHDLTYVELISLHEDIRIVFQTLKTIGNKSVADIGKHGIHKELAELRAQWKTLYEDSKPKEQIQGSEYTIADE